MGKHITRFQENRRRFLLFSEPLIRESNREKIVQFDKTLRTVILISALRDSCVRFFLNFLIQKITRLFEF